MCIRDSLDRGRVDGERRRRGRHDQDHEDDQHRGAFALVGLSLIHISEPTRPY